EADVLQQQDVAVVQAIGALVSVLSRHVASQRHPLVETLSESLSNRRQGQLRVDLALGAAQVGGDDDASPLVQQGAQRRDGRVDTARVGDLPVSQRNVQVRTNQHVAAFHAFGQKVLEGLYCHETRHPLKEA